MSFLGVCVHDGGARWLFSELGSLYRVIRSTDVIQQMRNMIPEFL